MKKNLKRRIKKGVATALAGITLASPSLAKTDISNYINQHKTEKVQNISLENRFNSLKKEYGPEISLPEIALNSALGYFMTTYIHELGHMAIAEAYGLDNIKLDTTITNEKVASFSYKDDVKLSNDQDALLNVGSSIATRTNYEVLNYLMKQNKIPKKLEPFTSTYALLSRFDMPYQIAIGARNHFFNGNNEYLDYEDFVNNISEEYDISKDTVYGILIGAELFDLYLDRKEIKNHFQRALGKEVDFNKEKDLDFDLIFDGKKLGFNVNYKF